MGRLHRNCRVVAGYVQPAPSNLPSTSMTRPPAEIKRANRGNPGAHLNPQESQDGSRYIQTVASTDEFTELRRRVMRRCVYALNALALRDDWVPRDGAFDAAAANALAAIVAYKASGCEYKGGGGWVESPTALLALVRREPEIKTDAIDDSELQTLKEGIEKAKSIRHGRADEEWDVLDKSHVDALISLDQHPALQVLEIVDGLDFAQAAFELYRQEAKERMPHPSDPKERSMVLEPSDCDSCGRMTLITEGFDAFGIGPGEGICIACGEERLYDDTVRDYLAWRFGETG